MSIGERLKSERERLKMSQTKLGKLGGVVKKTQFSYEQGSTYPHAKYLKAISNLGIDILHVVIGDDEIAPRTISPGRLDLGSSRNYHNQIARIHHRASQDASGEIYAENVISLAPGKKPNTKITPVSVINWQLLRQVLASMETFLNDQHLTLTPDKKASLILILYARFLQDKNGDQADFNDFIKASMAAL